MKMTPVLTLCLAGTISTFALINLPRPERPALREEFINFQVLNQAESKPSGDICKPHPAYVALSRNPQLTSPSSNPNECQNTPKPVLQVTFVLDVTGSMSGLIHTAKEKIWSIATSLTQTQPTPEIEIGLVAYRDRGDAFVTKITELSDDIDMVYSDLMSLTADGGGDEPESVNAGLHAAITKMDWDSERCTYRSIFLVGDCPPHMDYNDDVLYQESCEIARKKGIFINTIQMGDNPGTYEIWNDVANLGNGEYINVGMDAGGLTFTTPYDDEIARASTALENTRISYGTTEEIKHVEKKAKTDAMLNIAASPAAAADRAVFNLSDAGNSNLWGSNELLNEIEKGEVALDEIPASQLPEMMKELTVEERDKLVQTKLQERNVAEDQMKSLIAKRDSYISSNISDEEAGSSINTQIFAIVKKQAQTQNIQLVGKARQ